MGRDFDQLWEDKKAKPLEFTAKGKTFQLPGQMPAKLALMGLDMMVNMGPDADVPYDKVLDMLETAMGKDALDHLVDKGASMDQLSDILNWIMDEYQGGGGEGEDPNLTAAQE